MWVSRKINRDVWEKLGSKDTVQDCPHYHHAIWVCIDLIKGSVDPANTF